MQLIEIKVDCVNCNGTAKQPWCDCPFGWQLVEHTYIGKPLQASIERKERKGPTSKLGLTDVWIREKKGQSD